MVHLSPFVGKLPCRSLGEREPCFGNWVRKGEQPWARTALQGQLFNRERARWETPAGRDGAVGAPGSVGTPGLVGGAEGKGLAGLSLLLLLALAPGVLTKEVPAGKPRVKFELNFALKRNSVSVDPRQEARTAAR